MAMIHGLNGERRATVLETPYRVAAQPVPALPLEIEHGLLRYDLGVVRAKPFLPTETDSAVVEPVAGGVRVRGRRESWSYAHFFNDYFVSDLGIRVVGHLGETSNGILRIWFRRFFVDDAEMSYQLSVRPLLRQYRLARIAGSRSSTMIHWAESELIAGGTRSNAIEVRFRGDQIAVVANDRLVTLVQDGSFGRGDVVVGFWGERADDAFVYESVELSTVR